ncbi:hypothetical protein SteCoe_9464 [Stentor coeruleus]|uniref:Uncharacterized protein n=1 Tax=Stentor coeruleus TaxID=5963 RepID=A0A1R2CHT7_9CILI|nr:hypothetical protein SteCoe_9464 [Stentor coeruleus]
MANLEQFFIVKRGRPRKISKEFLRSLQESIQNSADSKTLKYLESQKKYLKENYCQKLKMMLSIIPKLVNFPYKVKSLPLLNLFEESAKKHLMNELEIAALSLLLGSVQWESTKYLVEEVIEACCLIAKRYFESNIELVNYLQTKLESQYSNLESIVSSVRKVYSLDLKSINKRLKTLLKHSKKFNVNYAYYVDEIIRMSPPYNIDLKKQKVDEKDSQEDDLSFEEQESEGMNFLYCYKSPPHPEKPKIFTIITKESKEKKNIQAEEILNPQGNEQKAESMKKNSRKIHERRNNSKKPKTTKNSYRSKNLDFQNNLENGNSKIIINSRIDDEMHYQAINKSLRQTNLNDLVPLDDYEKSLADSDFYPFEFSGIHSDDEENISSLLAFI